MNNGMRRQNCMVRVIASNCDTEEDIIYALMKIESGVYSENMRGEYESIKVRFQKYPEMFFWPMMRMK